MKPNLHDDESLFDYAGLAAREVALELDSKLVDFRRRLPPELQVKFREIEDLYAAESGATQGALIKLLRSAA